MSVRVSIPASLQTLTGGLAEVEASGATIAEVISDVEARHPGINERLVDGKGELRRFVNVYLGEEDVRLLQSTRTPVPDGSRILIIPAVAGGAEGMCERHESRFDRSKAPARSVTLLRAGSLYRRGG
jgi:molybdopterin synthase sulfur carrier subunit